MAAPEFRRPKLQQQVQDQQKQIGRQVFEQLKRKREEELETTPAGFGLGATGGLGFGATSGIGLGAATPVDGEPAPGQPTIVGAALDESNRGFRLLSKQGWTQGQGLGTREQGMTAPIILSTQTGRAGLGLAAVPHPPHSALLMRHGLRL
eukprot:COSAG05_NODE_323_length_11408_cov_361.826156_7_plen_150_part_00